MEKLIQLDGLLVHATAKWHDTDCVSRSFAPKCGVIEAPVCGSRHCHIVPYCSRVLHKPEIIAYQASKRAGTLFCNMENGKVKLSGKASLYSVADINI